ncbi:molecular chaperone TorD family protein [Georgenia sp. TF02-10]|uniref:TorD/DmsD family molecular chaperone n=1 Tax=Georgenia sp. TF02-10 TaxID=2917725 RepID=UPI001FA707D9|nr:molecular chaperone TorD family protein [Georgenia sp. TF02-10]UNX54006.1 molecular chaperone TorD family protein [Georgenia sp. TF02-10]
MPTTDRRTRPSAVGTITSPAADPALGVTLDHYATAYATLARLLLAAPTEGALVRLREPGPLRAWPLLLDEDCARGAALLAESGLAGETARDVRTDYHRLFRGPGPVYAPPRESAHLPADERSPVTTAVRRAYVASGLPAARLPVPEDHIGAELNLLARLCARGLAALTAADDAALAGTLAAHAAFLQEHLLRWAPRCLTLAANGSRTYFYQGVAALGLGTLRCARSTFLG